MLLDRSIFRRDYLGILDPQDVIANQYDQRDGEYWVKHRLAHLVNPGKIVEIGVRSGYSGWAMVRAAPYAIYLGYDNYSLDYADAATLERYRRYAMRNLHNPPIRTIVPVDTQGPGFKPVEADLYHVDGDHTYEGAKRDIENCLDMGSRNAVVAVHDFLADPVSRAVRDVGKQRNVRVVEIEGSPQGDVLVFKGAVPDWVHEMGKIDE